MISDIDIPAFVATAYTLLPPKQEQQQQQDIEQQLREQKEQLLAEKLRYMSAILEQAGAGVSIADLPKTTYKVGRWGTVVAGAALGSREHRLFYKLTTGILQHANTDVFICGFQVFCVFSAHRRGYFSIDFLVKGSISGCCRGVLNHFRKASTESGSPAGLFGFCS